MSEELKYNLYKYEEDFGRMGGLEALFIVMPNIAEYWKGSEIYWGEVLGKHSEIIGNYSDETITLMSEDQEKVNWLLEVMGTNSVSGMNPIEQLEERQDYYND